MNADNLMKKTYDWITSDITSRTKSLLDGQQLIVGIAGPPGGGKSSAALALQRLVPNSIVVPMDGYHYSKEKLSQFPNSAEAFSRRGSHWTFDSEAFVAALVQLKANNTGSFPAFQHGVGDPEENAIQVLGPPIHKVVIVEGNYLTIDIAPWNSIVDIVDHIYFIDCELSVVEQRLVRRHMEANGNSAEVAWERVRKNDSLNAELVLASKQRAGTIVQSV